MSYLQFREKIRKITNSIEHHRQIPERSKRVGFNIFIVFCSIGIVALLAVAFFLFIYQKAIAGLLVFGVAIFSSYIMYKIFTAPEIPDD